MIVPGDYQVILTVMDGPNCEDVYTQTVGCDKSGDKFCWIRF